MIRKFLLTTSFFTLILILFLVNSANNVMSISEGEHYLNTNFVNNYNNTKLDISNLVYDIDSDPLMFLLQIGLRNGGNGHILFLGIEILHTMILGNIAVKIKVDQFGF